MVYPKIWSISGNSVTHFDPSRPFGVVCHDAGGTNQIVAMLKAQGWRPSWVAAEGPAALIWQRDFPDIAPVADFGWVKAAASIITATGWASDLEHRARGLAQDSGVLSISVMDHWTNFQGRFVRDGHEVLPDEFWVVDAYAQRIVRSLFPSKAVFLQADFYAERVLAQVASLDAKTPFSLLYLLEPIRSDWGRGEPGEIQALHFFLECLPALGLPLGTKIRLRPHPSEALGKYDDFLREAGAFPVILADGLLAEELSMCRWVAGCQTYAMTLALRSGRTVFGTLPAWAPACALPHQGIVHLRDLMAV
jgi:hypothetical protein